MGTPAWQSLNGNERAIYIEMALRYAGIGSNNGRLHYSVREAAESLHISKATASRALRVLQERGFIVAMVKGAFSVKIKLATTWRLTEFPCDVENKPATRDFTKWTPEIQNTVSPQTATVPLVKPYGTSGETVVAKMSRNGTSNETVDAHAIPHISFTH